MGIRFFCPKGHKLNVKEFLAGKRAICPYCGLKVLVPTQSTRVSSRLQKSQQSQSPNQGGYSLAAPGAAASGSSPLDAAAVGSGSSIIIAGAGNIAVGSASATGPGEGSGFTEDVSDMLTRMSGAATAGDPSANAASVTDDANDVLVGAESPLVDANDPLSDTNNFLWYVRPASGGQLGPATNEIVRHWLAKGRVKADSFVWHEGWSDWQLAGNVFPKFGGLSKPNLSGLLADEQAAPAPAQTDLEQLLKPGPRKMQMATKVILAVLIVALVAVFVTVLIMSITG